MKQLCLWLIGCLLPYQMMQAEPVQYIGVVDPFSSGADYIQEIEKHGYTCVQIFSDVQFLNKIVRHTSHHESSPSKHSYSGSVEEVAAQLKDLPLIAILPGAEEGVLFSDQLNYALHLPFNGIEKSLARRDKALMHQAVAAAGIRIPKQKVFKTYEETVEWIQSGEVDFPVVIKPLASGGTDGVFLCSDEAAIQTAIANILDSLTIFNERNDRFLVQEYIDGIEYVVDTVSYNGRHYVTDFSQYLKSSNISGNNPFVYRAVILMSDKGEIQDKLHAYSSKVLDALDIKMGPAHIEVKINSRGEAVLMELGIRPAGANIPVIARLGTKDRKSQIEHSVQAYLNPDQELPASLRYEFAQPALVLCLQAKRAGKVVGIHKQREIESMQSWKKSFYRLAIGDILKEPTVDLLTSPGYIILSHPDINVLNADYQQICEWDIAEEIFEFANE